MKNSKTKYSKEQLDFIFNLRKKGRTVEQITFAFNENNKNWVTTYNGVEHIIRRNKHNYPEDWVTSRDVKSENTKAFILKEFQNWVKKYKYVPKGLVFCFDANIDPKTIRKHFGNFDVLEKESRFANPFIFKNIIDETSFTKEKFQELNASVLKYERFFITTAVTGCTPHKKGLAAIKTFCEKNKAKLLIILVSDPANNKPKKYKFSAHSDLPNDGIVFQDLSLNENLYISTIKLQAKQINPLTGLRGLASQGSCILGSPKQYLESVSTSNKKGLPHHLLTTGAITQAEYHTNNYFSERTAYLASEAHILGGVIVEILNNKIFFYRHVQIDHKTGAFSDLDEKYFPNKSEKITVELIQQPDWHMGSVCEKFKYASKDIIALLKPDILTLEDFCDNISINHHDKKKIIVRSQRLRGLQYHSLVEELEACARELDELCTWDVKKIVVKWGNHDDFLKRWLLEGGYITDVVNHIEGVTLAKAMCEGEEQPFAWAMKNRSYKVRNPDKITFLGVNDSFKVNGIENAVHGHLGTGGRRNPGIRGLDVYGPANTGHSHSPCIFGKVFRVGTATIRQLDYNDGASAWCNTLLVQHYDRSRQLITVIDGKWCLKKS